MLPYPPTRRLHVGRVSIEISVDMTTHFVAKGASLLYRAAKIAAVAPAGIPVIRTLTPSDTLSNPISRPKRKATPGKRSNRKILKAIVSRFNIVGSFTSAKIVPTINIVRAELQFPTYRVVSVITFGRGICVTMKSRPR